MDNVGGHSGITVLVAPDSFGDTLSAVRAAEIIGEGWLAGRPEDAIVRAPQSDGGPGFVDVLASRFGQINTETVRGPLGSLVDAVWLADKRDGQLTAYVECAQACGLHLLGGTPTTDTAVSASTYGVGQLVASAIAAGASTLIMGLGGSATTDGGRGMIEALGGIGAAYDALRGVRLVAATDVENPLLGPSGAAAVFGPQKGADPSTVRFLEDRVRMWADDLAAVTGRDVAGHGGAGAAGGLGAALLALGGRRVSGAAVIAEATDQASLVANSDLVITGEGRFDSQTLSGKVVAALTAVALRQSVSTIVLAGQVALEPWQYAGTGIVSAYSLADYAGSVELAISDAAHQLSGLARTVARTWLG